MKNEIQALAYVAAAVVGLILLMAESESTLVLILTKVVGIALFILFGWANNNGKIECLKKYFNE